MIGQHLITFSFSFLLAMIFVPVTAFTARRTGAMSHIDARRRRARSIPLLGGAAIYMSCAAIALTVQNSFLMLLLLAGLPVVAVGAFDDYKELTARPKLFAQLLSATLWVITRADGALILEQAGVPHGVSQGVTILWMVGITNAMNLIDGMDGVAGGVAFMVTFMLSLIGGEGLYSASSMILAGATLGFLFYNLPPARIYLGDSGSGFLGFALAALCSVLKLPEAGLVGVSAPLLLLAFPEIDTILAIARRIKNGKPIFIGDHSHLHHKLQKIGFRVRHALIVIYIAVAYCALGTYTLWQLPATQALLVLSLTVIGLTGALAVVFLWDHILGERITLHTHTVVSEQLGRQNVRTGIDKPFAGVAVDLVHCYREFQHCTPDRTEAFAREFSQLVKKFFPEGLYKTTDRSSVVVFFSEPGAVKVEQLSAFRNAFKSLMRAYNVLGSEEDTLESTVMYLPDIRSIRHERVQRRRAA